MGEVKVKATHDQWQWVTFFVGQFMMPEKLGERVYKIAERARIQEEVSGLFDALKVHSYYLQQHGNAYENRFGAKEDWKLDGLVSNGKPEMVATNPDKVTEVTLGDRAVSGALWLFTVLLTPPETTTTPDGKKSVSHPYAITPALASRFVWPIVEQMRKVKALRKAVGLVADEPLMRWDDDPAERHDDQRTEVAR